MINIRAGCVFASLPLAATSASAATLLFATGSAANAVPLNMPAATTSVGVHYPIPGFYYGGSYTGTTYVQETGAQASAGLAPPTASAAASTAVGETGHSADASVDYFLMITGPINNSVPIDIDVRLGSGATGPTGVVQSSASFGIWNSHGTYYYPAGAGLNNSDDTIVDQAFVCSNGPVCTDPSIVPYGAAFSGTLHDTIISGTIYRISLAANAMAQGMELDGCGGNCGSPTNPFGGIASAYADPYIYIDPTFANASLYGIALSEGVSNGPLGATPLPAALPLFATALGLGGAVGAYRKRKRSKGVTCRV